MFARSAALLVLMAGAAAASRAEASTTQSTFQVNLSIVATCSVQSASALSFGSTTGLTAATPATSTLAVQCSNGAPYNVGLNAGSGSGATVSNRLMTNPASATISYSIFQDAAHTSNWGNTVGTDTLAATGTGSAQSYTCYGLVSAQTTPAVGAYTDTITVTINY